MKKKLGRSQKVVYDWLKDHPESTAREVGKALYDKTSSCSGGLYGPTIWPIEKVRRSWASKLLIELRKKGCVEQVLYGKYRVVKE